MISSVSYESNASGPGASGGGSVSITAIANTNINNKNAVQIEPNVSQQQFQQLLPPTNNSQYGASVYQSASPIPCYEYAPVCYYPPQLFQPVADLPAAYLAAAAAAAASSSSSGNPPQSFPQQQVQLPTVAQQQAFLAMKEAATFGAGSTSVTFAVDSNATVTTSQQPQSSIKQKRRFSSPSTDDQFTSSVSLEDQVATPSSAPPIYGSGNEVGDQLDAMPPTAQIEDVATPDAAIIMQPHPHYYYPDQTSCMICTTEGQQRLAQQQQQQLMYTTAADNYYQQAATTQQQRQFYNAQQQRAGLPPLYDGGSYWPAQSSLISSTVSSQQTQQQQQQLWRLQNAAAALGVGAPVLVDGDTRGSPVHSRFWAPRGSQFTPPPPQQFNHLRPEQEALIVAQEAALAANYRSALDLQQHQLVQTLQGLNLLGSFGGGSTTGGAGSVHSDGTYSPQQLFQSQEALRPSSSHLNYPSQTSSPFSAAQFYAMQQHQLNSGVVKQLNHSHHQQPQTTQMSPEFDPNELAHVCPGINPQELDPSLLWRTRYFVIKSNSSRNVMLSVQHGVWCSTPAGNECLNKAFLSLQQPLTTQRSSEIDNGSRDSGVDSSMWSASEYQQPQANQKLESNTNAGDALTTITTTQSAPTSSVGRVLLFFSVNSSGCFCGVAEMTSPVNKLKQLSIWQDSRWRGAFSVRWLYAKNVPNRLLRHILVESLENRAVTHLRDTNEILPPSKGEEMLRIIHKF